MNGDSDLRRIYRVISRTSEEKHQDDSRDGGSLQQTLPLPKPPAGKIMYSNSKCGTSLSKTDRLFPQSSFP